MDPETPLTAALRRIAGATRLLVALDFDGTLAPTVDHPEAARALPEATGAVARLSAAPDTRVAYISGRAMASLKAVSSAPESTLLVGSHGIQFQLAGDDGEASARLDEREKTLLAGLAGILADAVATADGAWLEEKPAGYAVHTRLAADTDARRVQRLARAGTAHLAGLTVRDGKDVLEFSVRSTTKGAAITRLRAHTGATAIFFAGDDVTDEDAFLALECSDVGVKVGPGETAAGYRVRDPHELARTLTALAQFRAVFRPAPPGQNPGGAGATEHPSARS
jgi:trehalose 6-phosphate phosphatase